MNAARWESPPDRPDAQVLAARLGLHPLMGRMLVNRGLDDLPAALEFLRPGPAPDPWQMRGVREAAWRIWQAVRRREPVVVYGDYDADGLCSTAILLRALRRLGAVVHPFIPHRLSLGYGLHREVLLEMAERGIRLVVAVDCGLTAVSAVQQAKRRGLDVVVVDHHEPARRLPPAAAIVAAHRLTAWPGGPQMSAAGLAYHTARALLELGGASGEDPELLQLAAAGTIADVVSLIGENRRLVREGLAALRAAPLPGFAALGQVAGLDLASADTYHVAFVLAPRLNAAGRVDDALVGLELLLAGSVEQAMEAARRLEAANRLRQSTEAAVLEQAMGAARQSVQARDPPVLVVVGEGWHPGVIGVVAARLVSAFFRPAVVVSVEGDQARGSARSVAGVDIYEALSECAHLFSRFGGHPMAAGFSLERDAVAGLAGLLEAAVARRFRGPFVPVVRLDGWVRLGELHDDLASQLGLLEPHGEGNPRPVLAAAGLELMELRTVGADGRHLRLSVREPSSGAERGAVAFGKAEAWAADLSRLVGQGRIDVAFIPQKGRFGGLELQVVDVRPAAEVGAVTLGVSFGLRTPSTGASRVVRVGAPPAGSRELAVVDVRGLADGGAQALAGWLQEHAARVPPSAFSVVVAVRGPHRAVELSAALAWSRPDGALRSAWGDRELLAAPTAGSATLFEESWVLVSWDPWVLSACRHSARTVVFWELPDLPQAWAQAAHGAAVREVVLAYGSAPAGGAGRPERGKTGLGVEELRRIYRWLAAHVRLAGPRLPPATQLASALAMLDPEVGMPEPQELEAALRIFEELGVAEGEPGGAGWRWKGVAAGTKLDLTRSPLYNEVTRERAYWGQYVRRAVELPARQVWLDWVQGAISTEKRPQAWI